MSFVTTFLRPDDLFFAEVEFVNLALDTQYPGRPRLMRVAGQSPSMVVRLPSQHVTEEVVGASASAALPYRCALAAPSRLAFDVPASAQLPEFRIDAILAFIATLPLRPCEGTVASAPMTVLEVPYRLLLSPRSGVRLLHRPAPLAQPNPDGDIRWTGHWSTRLVEADGAAGGPIALRAVANPNDQSEAPSWPAPLNRAKRQAIVQLSQSSTPPHTIAARDVQLSPLGASLDLRAAWPQSSTAILSAWEHSTTLGRDARVRTAEPGFLFPFGHRATKETVIRREVSSHSGARTRVAELRAEVTIRVDEPERAYPANGYDHGGREMPFKRIRITSEPGNLPSDRAPIPLSVLATDAAGRNVALSLQMLFASRSDIADERILRDLANRFLAVNSATLDAASLTLAADTALTVSGLRFEAKLLSPGALSPPFLPRLRDATVSLPSAEVLLASAPGRAADNAAVQRTFRFDRRYLAGFAAGDREQVFGELDPPMPGPSMPAERSGGLSAPKFAPANKLSRARGLLAEPASGSGPIDPQQIISDAKLLGMIDLKTLVAPGADVFPNVDPARLYDEIDAPSTVLSRPVLTTVKRPDGRVEVRFLWKPALRTDGFAAPLMATDGRMSFYLKGRVLAGAAAQRTAEFEGRLVNFGLAFGNALSLAFRGLTFRSSASRKMELTADIARITFGPDLDFIAKLRELLPTDRLGGAPQVQTGPDGVVIRYGIAIPSFGAGVVNLENIAVSTSLSLPFFGGRPVAVRFALSERHRPFLVSASIFGGTGFLAIEVRTDGSMLIEGGIEFGGVVSINLLGIVRGGVYAFVGFYVAYDTAGGFTASGHIRFGGYVEVLAIISVAIEVYIALSYIDGVLLGEGRLTISVKVLFFSLSQSFVVRRRIAGFGESPDEARVLDAPPAAERPPAMTRQHWARYCDAFA